MIEDSKMHHQKSRVAAKDVLSQKKEASNYFAGLKLSKLLKTRSL